MASRCLHTFVPGFLPPAHFPGFIPVSVCAVMSPLSAVFCVPLGECAVIYLHIFWAHGYLGSFMLGAAMNLAAVNITNGSVLAYVGLCQHESSVL